MDIDFRKQIFHVFLEEFEENIDKIEEILYKDTFNQEEVNTLFRVFHSIKGSSSFAELDDIKDFAHIVENLFQQIRNNNLKVDEKIKNLLYSIIELFKKVINNLKQDKAPFYLIEKTKDQILLDCNLIFENKDELSTIYILKYKPPVNIFLQGLDPLVFIKDLKNVSEFIEVNVNLTDLYNLSYEEFKPDCFYSDWQLKIKSSLSIDEIKAIFEFIDFEQNGKLEINIEQEFASAKKTIAKSINENINEISQEEETKEKELKEVEKSYIKINSLKVDNLISLLKDISILSSIQSYNIENKYEENQNEIINITSRLYKMILQAQQQVLELKMVSIKNYIIPLKRKIENLARQLNKEVKFIIEGVDEEIDKQIIDNILEPIEHLIRNALDHGIETKEERKRKNKNEEGIIKLTIYRKKNSTFIEISDDGKGIDKEAIIQKAISLNLISENDSKNLKENEIYDIIFYPGFSTKQEVTEISGRGVGLDVVKANLTKLNGKIEIKSEIDRGTTFILQLPLLLSILDCMVFTINNIYFAVPLVSIKHIINAQIKNLLDNNNLIIEFKGKFIGVVNIYENLNFNIKKDFEYKENNLFLIIENNNNLKAYYCEEIFGQQNLIVNSLSNYSNKLKGIFGTSILGNGEICYIIDPDEIKVEEKV